MKLAVSDVPLAIVARTVTDPAAVVLSMLPPVINAPVVPALSTLQVIAVYVALDGATVPVRIWGVPAVADKGTPVIPVTGMKPADILTVAVLVTCPRNAFVLLVLLLFHVFQVAMDMMPESKLAWEEIEAFIGRGME